MIPIRHRNLRSADHFHNICDSNIVSMIVITSTPALRPSNFRFTSDKALRESEIDWQPYASSSIQQMQEQHR